MYNENDTLDLLDAIECVEKSFEFSKDENERLETAVKALNKLNSDEVDAISGVLLLLSKFETKVEKSISTLWPSLTNELLPIAKARAGIGVRAEDNGSKWPSLSLIE